MESSRSKPKNLWRKPFVFVNYCAEWNCSFLINVCLLFIWNTGERNIKEAIKKLERLPQRNGDWKKKLMLYSIWKEKQIQKDKASRTKEKEKLRIFKRNPGSGIFLKYVLKEIEGKEKKGYKESTKKLRKISCLFCFFYSSHEKSCVCF